MNRPQRSRANQRRRPQNKRPAGVDLWRDTGELPDFEPLSVPHDVGALLRSLGDPPMNHGNAAGHYFSSVVERAAAVALALAISADLVADTDKD